MYDVPSRQNHGDKIHIVSFTPGDPTNPRNWPRWRKWLIVGSVLFVDLTVSFGASGFSPASTNFAKDFGASNIVATLGLSIYVGGLALGPMALAPLSEVGFISCRSIIKAGSLTVFSTLEGPLSISFHTSYTFASWWERHWSKTLAVSSRFASCLGSFRQ